VLGEIRIRTTLTSSPQSTSTHLPLPSAILHQSFFIFSSRHKPLPARTALPPRSPAACPSSGHFHSPYRRHARHLLSVCLPGSVEYRLIGPSALDEAPATRIPLLHDLLFISKNRPPSPPWPYQFSSRLEPLQTPPRQE
jgi:hypothetical protein